MYSIADFKAINHLDKIVLTQHSRKRFAERGISVLDILEVIETGEVIEQYPGDFPFPSCLIMGKSEEITIHVVASINEGMIYIITAYVPDISKWNNDLKTRKEKQ